jgi:hypothetical protein
MFLGIPCRLWCFPLFGKDGSGFLVCEDDLLNRIGSVLEVGRVVVEVGREEDVCEKR